MFSVTLLLATTASAVTINVSNSAQLVNAFATAQANPNEWHDIVMSRGTYTPSSTLTLTTGAVNLIGSTSGYNPHLYVIDGQNMRRLFHVYGTGYLSIKGVTIQNGSATVPGNAGAGVLVQDGGIGLIERAIIRNNRASFPGSGVAVSNAYVFMSFVTIDNNVNNQFPNCGGGVTSGGGGLGVYENGFANVHQSTFTNNKACRGAAIAVTGNSSSLYLENSTVSTNEALYRGGGILFQGGAGSHMLRFNTIAFNKAGTTPATAEKKYGGGIGFWGFGGHLQATGNIIAKNEVTYDMKSTLFYKGSDCFWESGFYTPQMQYNVIGDLSNCSQFGSDGWPEIGWEGDPLDPMLGPLTTNGSKNGYQLLTHKPLPGSPVINAFHSFNAPSCDWDCPLPFDQRGYSRPNWGSANSDVGAVEFNGVP